MDRTKKPAHRDDQAARRAGSQPTRDDVHEQRVPDQAAEGTLQRETESQRLRRPPNVDEAGGR